MLPDLIFALLLPLPPWLGFQLFKRKGRVGLSYGYFLGGIVCVLALPWPDLGGLPIPTTQLGGSLLGFTFFLQALREGAQGLRRLSVGLGGAGLFILGLLWTQGLPLNSLGLFTAIAITQGLFWILLSDLSYRFLQRRMELRMPLVGAAAAGIGSLLMWLFRARVPHVHVLASILGGALLGLVALEQLLWLRKKGAWVSGRGESLRSALRLLDQERSVDRPALSLNLDARQTVLLVDDKGTLLEANGPASRLLGLPRHLLRGYRLDSLLQGGERAVWEDLREQLVRDGHACSTGILVRKDGSFDEVALEAVGFDLNLALVWVADARSGSLAVRGEEGGPVFTDTGLGAEAGQRLVNALGSILPAAERILGETREPATRESAALILQAAQRLRPLAAASESPEEGLDATDELEALVPLLQRMLPAGIALGHRTPDLRLRVTREALHRIASHLLLQARQGLEQGTLTLAMERRTLGGREWARWTADAEGRANGAPREVLGLAWLLQVVRQARGMLECSQDERGGILPAVYLPLDGAAPAYAPLPLLGRRTWILDRDPLVRESMAALLRQYGGEAEAFGGLRELLKRSREEKLPDLLVLERNPLLDRFQKPLRQLARQPLPTLVLGNGQALPLDPAAFGIQHVGFLEKPFASQDLVQSLLALLGPEPEAGCPT